MNNFNEEKLPEGWEVKSLADIVTYLVEIVLTLNLKKKSTRTKKEHLMLPRKI